MRSDRFMRLSDDDGRLLELIDGRRSVLELAQAAGERFGPAATARMLGLLPELGERGFLEGVGTPEGPAAAPQGLARRLLRPREAVWPGAGRRVEQLYRDGGHRLLTLPALIAMEVVAVLGLVAFGDLVVGRYGTPFVVAHKVGLGGFVFLAGRLAVAAVHEIAHGLVLTSFGRRVGRAGIKVILVFPFAFVDTSEAWFEPRRRRIAVSAAGPASDAILGGIFASSSLMLGPGTMRDVFFQLALGAYLAAIVNLNPFVERDGYHILADVLGEPGLRRRARVELRRRLGGEAPGSDSRVLAPYALAGLAWSVVAGAAAVVVSLRYAPALRMLVPAPVVSGMLAFLWAGVLSPVILTAGRPLLDRLRGKRGAA
jgi:putative peptide zinc metalloprotease protein